MSDLPEKQIKRLRALITEAETNLAAAKELLISVIGDEETVSVAQTIKEATGQVIEGDVLKLTITEEGKFMYKQIGPTERKQVIGTLTNQDGLYYVEVNGKEYRILLASVTYFRLEIGSQVTILIPADNPDATWAAVEAKL